MSLSSKQALSLIVVLAGAVVGSGCGLIFQKRETTVKITTDPPGAEVRFAGHTLISPATVRVPRRRSSEYVVRISKEGYLDACRVVRFRTNGALVALDSIPLALGLAVDAAAGTWPGNLPSSVAVPLMKGSNEEIEPLPSDDVLLRMADSRMFDPCMAPRERPEEPPRDEKTSATYLLRLRSVTANGEEVANLEEELLTGDSNHVPQLTEFRVTDDPVRIEVTPKRDIIDLRLTNEAATSVKVLWDDAVFVDFDQTSNPIGRRRPDYGSMETDSQSVIAPRTAIEKSVFSRNRTFERTRTVEVTDETCSKDCTAKVFQCMSAYNCSGYRSRQPYTGDGWLFVAIAERYSANLCERRCVDFARACLNTCARTIEDSEGIAHLDVVPPLHRKCSRDEDEFERTANTADLGSYAVLLPIEVSGKKREYMLRFEPVLFDFEMSTDCSYVSRANSIGSPSTSSK